MLFPPPMPKFREFVFGPWRAVAVLGVTQILAWAALFYPPVLMMPLIAAERGWSLFFAMCGFSLALLVAGFCAPTMGGLIDRHGGHVVMSAGALLGALGLVCLTLASHWAAYLATWIILGVAIAATLYDPAFATLGRIFGACRAPPDYRTDARRRFRFDGELAGDAFFPVMDRLENDLSDLCRIAGAGRGSPACLPASAHARLHAKAFRRQCRVAVRAVAVARAAFHPGRDRVRGLRLRAVRPGRAFAGDVRPRGHRSRDRRFDRRAVRALSGRRAAFGVYFRQQRAPAHHRAARAGDAACRLCAAGAVWILGADRNGVRDHVRSRQRPDHHHPWGGAARALRCCRLRAPARTHRQAVPDHAGFGAGRARLRGRAFLG